MIVRAKLSIGFPGACRFADIEIPDEDLEGLDPQAREMLINDYVRDWGHEYIDWNWEE